MLNPGERRWSTSRCRTALQPRRTTRATRENSQPSAAQRRGVPPPHPRRRDPRADPARRRHRRRWSSARCRRCRSSASLSSTTSAGTRSPRSSARCAPIYGTLVTSLIAMVIAVPVGLLHRPLPHRAVPDVAAPADRHRDRAAGRHPEHHLRHLGPVRLRAVPAALRAAVPDRRLRPRSRCSRRCSQGRPTASAC